MSEYTGKVKRDQLIPDQIAGAVIDALNRERLGIEIAQLTQQDAALNQAFQVMDATRKSIEDPGSLLGNDLTKHGEIAERVEVGLRNARSIIDGQKPVATFDGIGRTAPTDYIIDGEHVQSKFINGARNTLDHIRNHMDTYKGFGGSGGYYHIPKDTHAQIARVLNGKETELSERVQRTIREKVALIEQETGRPFMEAVRPSVSEYGEIQRGTVSKTLDRSEDTLRERNAEKKANIADSHRPSLSDAAKAVGLAAAVTGVFSLTTSFYAKCKSGKNPFKGDFTADDWRDVGVSTAKGTAGGTVSAGAIYVMTNYSRMSAPLASAFVSAGKGVYALQRSYSRGEIDAREFVELGTVACSEAAIVAVVTALGQIAIPIPLLGPTIGSMAGRLVAEFATGKTKEEADRMRKDMENFLARLDGNMLKVFSSIELEFDRLGSLTAAAFDMERNCSLVLASIELARAYGVEESRILKTNDDLERFLFS